MFYSYLLTLLLIDNNYVINMVFPARKLSLDDSKSCYQLIKIRKKLQVTR